MTKTYTFPDGKKAVFEYDHNGVGKITLECMDMLMSLLGTTTEQTEPQTDTHDIRTDTHECVKDTHDKVETMSCQECKWWFTDSLKHGGYCQSLLYNHECRYEPEVDCSWK